MAKNYNDADSNSTNKNSTNSTNKNGMNKNASNKNAYNSSNKNASNKNAANKNGAYQSKNVTSGYDETDKYQVKQTKGRYLERCRLFQCRVSGKDGVCLPV